MTKRPTYEPVAVDISGIRGAAYNPREADEFRDAMLRFSLLKFGWLIPAFADTENELLSGHQRTRISVACGASRVPVIRAKRLPEGRRKAINLLFNRATNDMMNSDSSSALRERLEKNSQALLAHLNRMPDLDPTSDEFMPVLRPKWMTVRELLQLNDYAPDNSMMAASEHLIADGMMMPIVLSESGKIINGKGRLPAYSSAGYDEVPCTIVPNEHAEVLETLLNAITMDFTLHKQYADVLRFNSFRRANGTKDMIGMAFRFDLFPQDADWESDEVWERWRSHYGEKVLDWGAGLLQDAKRLTAVGVDAVPFEPYLLDPGTQNIDIDSARDLTLGFLEKIADGFRFTSIFQNSVFNSVPFLDDRQKIVRIISALCSHSTRVYACAISVNSTRAKAMVGHKRAPSQESKARASFSLDYEPNVAIAELATLPKVQKYHTQREWWDLWSVGFNWVKAGECKDLVTAVCKQPKPVDRVALREAIEFEFDLPYPSGERMGLVDEALAAFSRRLGMDL